MVLSHINEDTLLGDVFFMYSTRKHVGLCDPFWGSCDPYCHDRITVVRLKKVRVGTLGLGNSTRNRV